MSRESRFVLALVTLLGLTGPAAAIVTVTDPGGATRVTVIEREASPIDLLREIARQSGRVLIHPRDITTGEIIPIDLRNRPLATAVEILAGCEGLIGTVEKGVIRLAPEPLSPTVTEVRRRAIEAFTTATFDLPDHARVVEARLAMGRLHVALGESRMAQRQLQAALTTLARDDSLSTEELKRVETEILGLLAQSHYAEEDWSGAIRYLEPLATRPNASRLVRMHYARARYELGDIDSAIAELREIPRVAALPHDDLYFETRYVLGRAHEARHEYEAALAEYRTASAGLRESVSGAALRARAALFDKLSRPGMAVEALVRFLDKFPSSDDIVAVSLEAADGLAKLDKPVRAVALLERLRANHPEALDPIDGAIRIASLWAAAGLTARAEEVIADADAKIDESDPRRVRLLATLTRVFDDAALPERARPIWRRLAAFPEYGLGARVHAARCLVELGEHRPAARELERIDATKLDAEARELRRTLLITCYTELGNREAARRVMEGND